MYLVFLGGPIIRPHKQPLCETTFSHSTKAPVIAVKRRGLTRGLEVLAQWSLWQENTTREREEGQSLHESRSREGRGRDWEPTIPFQAMCFPTIKTSY